MRLTHPSLSVYMQSNPPYNKQLLRRAGGVGGRGSEAGGLLDSTWLVIVLDVFEGPQTSGGNGNNNPAWQHTTAENDAEKPQSFLQQVRKCLNGKKAEWEKERRGVGGHCLWPGAAVFHWSRSNGMSDSGWILPRMHHHTPAGIRSKWELVHYGSAARYKTSAFTHWWRWEGHRHRVDSRRV